MFWWFLLATTLSFLASTGVVTARGSRSTSVALLLVPVVLLLVAGTFAAFQQAVMTGIAGFTGDLP